MFNTRKANRELGKEQAQLLRRVLEGRTVRYSGNRHIADELRQRGLVEIDSRGPGWSLEVFSRDAKCVAAGYWTD